MKYYLSLGILIIFINQFLNFINLEFLENSFERDERFYSLLERMKLVENFKEMMEQATIFTVLVVIAIVPWMISWIYQFIFKIKNLELTKQEISEKSKIYTFVYYSAGTIYCLFYLLFLFDSITFEYYPEIYNNDNIYVPVILAGILGIFYVGFITPLRIFTNQHILRRIFAPIVSFAVNLGLLLFLLGLSA